MRLAVDRKEAYKRVVAISRTGGSHLNNIFSEQARTGLSKRTHESFRVRLNSLNQKFRLSELTCFGGKKSIKCFNVVVLLVTLSATVKSAYLPR